MLIKINKPAIYFSKLLKCSNINYISIPGHAGLVSLYETRNKLECIRKNCNYTFTLLKVGMSPNKEPTNCLHIDLNWYNGYISPIDTVFYYEITPEFIINDLRIKYLRFCSDELHILWR